MTWFLTKTEEGLGKERKEESQAARLTPHASPDTLIRLDILEALNVPVLWDAPLTRNVVSQPPSPSVSDLISLMDRVT